MKSWKALKLGEVVNFKRGHDLPESQRRSGRIPIVSSSGITGYHCESKASAPGVVTGRYGTIGKVFYVDEPFWPLNTTLYITDFNGNHEKFIYYFLQTIDFDKYNDKSTVPGINRNHLHLEEVIIPPLPEQKSIASVLSSLDDKIDLLHRQNATLEAMAETLFRQWFVEEAKEEWEEGVLGDVIELLYGKGLKAEVRTGSGYPVVGSSGIVGHHSEFLVEAPGIVIGRKGTLGKITYLFDNFFPIDTTYFVKSKNKSPGLFFEYFLLKSMNFLEMNSDSAVPGLNRDIALSTDISIPPDKWMNEFNRFCAATFAKIDANSKQLATLELLRDALLPKLMSGEVRAAKV